MKQANPAPHLTPSYGGRDITLVHRRSSLLGFSANGIHEEISDEQV